VVVDVEEAYIHCSKHVPLLKRLDKQIAWGIDDETDKNGDFLKLKTESSPYHLPHVRSETVDGSGG
jgi:hypothetical protein